MEVLQSRHFPTVQNLIRTEEDAATKHNGRLCTDDKSSFAKSVFSAN